LTPATPNFQHFNLLMICKHRVFEPLICASGVGRDE
jgi:hypothetical protein